MAIHFKIRTVKAIEASNSQNGSKRNTIAGNSEFLIVTFGSSFFFFFNERTKVFFSDSVGKKIHLKAKSLCATILRLHPIHVEPIQFLFFYSWLKCELMTSAESVSWKETLLLNGETVHQSTAHDFFKR